MLITYGSRVLALETPEGLELPGGKVEDFDATYLDCALRELEEETGVDLAGLTTSKSPLLSPLGPKPYWQSLNDTGEYYVTLFHIRLFCRDLPSFEDQGVGTPVWVTWEQFLFGARHKRFYNLCPTPLE